MRYKYKTFREEEGKLINGIIIPAIISNFNFWLTQIVIFADGKINCWELVSFDQFKQMVYADKILISVPDGSKLFLPNWGEIEINNFISYKTKEDFIIEVEDILNELNGKISRTERCRTLFKEYLINPDNNTFTELKNEFKNLPNHKNVIIDMVDYKDPLIGLMIRDEKFNFEQRKDFLDDYFDYELK
ncbi:hypothetical protein [Flavobacterium sp. JAS]|uniref:DUF7638 domain-containing protein n=1 Tax=Flavobacterium sp. JAS TaxID=2897329 RepID=UPI001E50F906|nr:hypothetical protein [Flavobacterium sp. JAS]MCD0471348.1 hypothetical protein [Flavobacterium sp. JAS]